jgi:hypothetical protein
VWHASVHGRYGAPVWLVLEEIARVELRGVGDATAGEWAERGLTAFHLRRRLTAKEMVAAGITSVCDVRGTTEQQERIARMRPFLPGPMSAMPVEALP